MSGLLVLLMLFLALPVRADVLFDGVDDSADTALALSNFITATDGALLFWVKTTTANTETITCDDYEGGWEQLIGDESCHWCFFLLEDVTVCSAHDATADVSRMPVAYTSNTWLHLALVHTGGTMTVYTNGAVVSAEASGNTLALGDLVHIGGPWNFFAYGPGTFADVRWYATAPSASEIAAIAGGRRTRLGKIVPSAHWTFEQCTPGASAHGITFRDQSWHSRPIAADDGANNTGMTCQASTILSRWGGVQ